jgi:transitional endoplasmic reticulum ATPase
MTPELLETLLAALQLSPDNALLREQVVKGLLALERWAEVVEVAPPLCATEQRAGALIALARARCALGDLAQAREHYAEAIRVDARQADEELESALSPEEDLFRLPIDGFAPEPSPVRPARGPRISFADVGGMEELKEQIRLNILYPFEHPEIYAAYGKKIGGGLLLYGPPGCGKTHIARATAGELGANFFLLELNDVLSMWIGESEKHLSELFETARANTPAVIFIDEVDALGAKRSEMHSSPIRMVVSQLLTEMDGFSTTNSQVLVLGATNEPWNVDPAFRRPGRFDRVLFVPPPDAAARREILQLHAQGRKIDPALSWEPLAGKTDRFSGADLAALVDRASELALSEAIKSGKLRPVGLAEFHKALRDMRPTTVEWLRRAKNYVLYANQDGLYDTLARYLEEQKLK